ncbi:glycoside hydrolase [Cantharellus anzutake]|uniref:glycoside hydrolase n=1 Tax=Cantharellus anzutake TaxID=1750568 RepID=UPI001903C048|nr:glycoside hydrolase [Cantharellus anzutake]KAF8343125.1 glycoside hydrolase [Cantharellus anzutake]
MWTSTLFIISTLLLIWHYCTIKRVLPVDKIYGVNIGNWYAPLAFGLQSGINTLSLSHRLLSEPWIFPGKWIAMGGEICNDCSKCRMSEWSLSNYLGRNKTNQVFQEHWANWLTQDDVNAIVNAKLNTVRIPIPFWVVEDIVDNTTEPYAQGGLDELIRGLEMFRKAGIWVILVHHALPGVSASNQMFAGNCTENVQFYSSQDDYNYKRAVTWAIVMTFLTHRHPAFKTVFSIEAINEPTLNYSQTPGLSQYYKAFVLGVRLTELSLGIICDRTLATGALTNDIVLAASTKAIPIITKLARKYNIEDVNFDFLNALVGTRGKVKLRDLKNWLNNRFIGGRCIATQFMSRDWQYSTNGTPVPNPADAARGPQLYDNHLYFYFGGVSKNETEYSYMVTICNYTYIAQEASIGNAPFYTGEWAISASWDATDEFLKKWGDAQKLAYGVGSGWMFWTWKVDPDATVPRQDMWSYQTALKNGLLKPDPSAVFDPNVCGPYK